MANLQAIGIDGLTTIYLLAEGTGTNLDPFISKFNVNNWPSSYSVTGTFWQATQPVSLVSLPSLPTGSNTIGAISNSSFDVGNFPSTQTVNGSITANIGTISTIATASNQTTIIGHVDGIEELLTTIDSDTSLLSGAISNSKFQVDIVTLPTVNISDNGGSLTVDGTVELGSTSLAALENISVTVSNSSTEITNDVGNPIPVNGTVTANIGTVATLATATNQTTGNTSLSNIDTKIPSLGQALAAASTPVVLTAAQLSTLTPLTTVGVSSLPALPTGANAIGSITNSTFASTQSGTWSVGLTGTLPAFAATPTVNLGTISTIATESSLSSLNGKFPTGLTVSSTRLLVDGSGVTQPVSLSSTTISNFPSTQAVSLAALPSLPTGSNVIGSIANSSFGISGTLPAFAATPTVNLGTIGTVATETTLSGLNTKVPSGLTVSSTRLLVDNSGVTQPISGSLTNISGTISLPTLASTSTLQTTGNTSLSSIDTKLPSNLTVTSTRLLVDSLASDSIYVSNAVVFTRGANTTAYTAGDVYGTKMEITGFGVANGGFVITNIDGVSSLASIPLGMGSFRLFLFASDPSAIADNAAFTLASSSITPKGISLDTLSVVTNATVATLQTDFINITRRRASSNLFAYVVTQAAFTPAAATANTLTLTLRGVAT